MCEELVNSVLSAEGISYFPCTSPRRKTGAIGSTKVPDLALCDLS